jgi:hypothetical protein
MVTLESYMHALNACVFLNVLSLFVIFVIKYAKPWEQIMNLKNVSLYTYFLNDKYITSRAMFEVGNVKHGHVRSKKTPIMVKLPLYLIDHHVVKFGYDSHFLVTL